MINLCDTCKKVKTCLEAGVPFTKYNGEKYYLSYVDVCVMYERVILTHGYSGGAESKVDNNSKKEKKAGK
jgi:hypothetical protein